MKVLIVAKTHMSGYYCLGGLARDTNRNVRLMQPDGSHQPITAKYEVGQVWDIEFRLSEDLKPPHVEDVIVHDSAYLGRVRDIKGKLLERVKIWPGSAENIFGGFLNYTENRSAYISAETRIPEQSVGFWMPDEKLFSRLSSNGRTRYHARDNRLKISYVGTASPIEVIPAGTLLRMSLSRWWTPYDNPDGEKRCYLQLSGWFL